MSNITIPNNPNIPTPSFQKGNVSSLVSPDILNNLQKAKSPLAFGDQLTNPATSLVTGAVTNSPIAKLLEEQQNLIQEGITLEINHQINLQKLEAQHAPSKKIENGQTVDVPPKLNDEEYAAAVTIENTNYEATKTNIEIKVKANNDAIANYFKDPFKKHKEKKQKRTKRTKEAKKQIRQERKKAAKERIKTALKSAAKSLAPLIPVLTSTLASKIIEVAVKNSAIAKLVDDTNVIIEDANASNDPIKLNNAKLARDNAIKIIQNVEEKIKKIRDALQKISIYINIFNVIVQVISAIPIPTSVPPGIGIPINAIMKLVKILDKASRIVSALSAVIPILTSALDKVIEELEKQKARLLPINGILDASATTIQSSLISNPNQFGTIDETYKGFKFAIREDNKPGSEVRGFKRHYAVAIDTNNVDVLKSEASFTLDPDDLIETLKIIIDRENLIA